MSSYYKETALMYILRGLTGLARWLDPYLERTEIRSLFAGLIAELHSTPTEDRPSTFMLEQAYIDSPKDDIFNVCIPSGHSTDSKERHRRDMPTEYRPLPSVLLRFNKHVMSHGGKSMSNRLIVLYLSFRRALSDEPEQRQKEYLQELATYIASDNYKSTDTEE